MKKRSILQKPRKTQWTIGLDLGDRHSRYCALDQEGTIVWEGSVTTRQNALRELFGALACCRVVIEVGTHSPWISRLLATLGHEVIVANARKVRLIAESKRKNDKLDARTLARLARADPQLLCPIRHRCEQAQADLAVIRARAAMVESRTGLINTVRGLVKSFGARLPKCDAAQIGPAMLADVPAPLHAAVRVLLEQIAAQSRGIEQYDAAIEQLGREQYPETELLRQVHGVGPVIALSYVLTVDDAGRFRRSREVGAYLGLQPSQRESGQSRPQLRISKEGDRYLRKLLVQGAQTILRCNGSDCDLRRWGLRLAARGGKNAKKRAVVAVARKLAVLLHRLWVTGEVYEPLRNAQARLAAA